MASLSPKPTPCPNLEYLDFNGGDEIPIHLERKSIFYLQLMTAFQSLNKPRFFWVFAHRPSKQSTQFSNKTAVWEAFNSLLGAVDRLLLPQR
jgi:hypothetical protein